jgi:DHA1 family bicyclomycin/chloramphenicol resistance-like MFS transporter
VERLPRTDGTICPDRATDLFIARPRLALLQRCSAIDRLVMLRPGSFALTVLLALVTAIGPLSIDLYIPAMPEIGRLLDAPASLVQLTISVYLIGFAGGQIVYGPISDRYGRKPVLMAALLVFCAGTLACAVAPGIAALITTRAIQGFGASGAIVLPRAIIRDLYEGPRAGRELSIMAMIMGLAPIIGPVIGGALQTVFGWRADFLFILAAGMVAAMLSWRLLPETRKSPTAPLSFANVLRSYRLLLGHRGYLANITLAAISFCGLFAWISASPFVLQDLYGLSAFSYGLAFALAAVGFMAGTSLAATIVVRLGLDRTIGIGGIVLAAGGFALLAAVGFLPRSGVALALPVAVYLAGMGLIMPQAFASALQPFPHHAGAASALGGVIQQSAAAVAGAAVAHALGASAWPLAIAVASAGCLTPMVWLFTRGVRKV